MPLGMEVGLGPGDIVLDEDPAPLLKKGAEPLPNFRPMSIVAKRKMTLGMEVGLGPGHIVLNGDPVPLPQNGGRAPYFRPIFIVAKWLDESRCHLVWR